MAGTRILTIRHDFGIANIDDKLYLIGGFSRISVGEGIEVFAVNEQYTPFGYRNTGTVSIILPDGSIPLSVIASAGLAAAVIAGFLVYLKKRTHKIKT